MHGARLLIGMAAVAILGACGGERVPEPPAAQPAPPVRPSTATVGTQPELHLDEIATGLDAPLYATAAPGQPDRLYVVEQAGTIRVLENGALLDTPFLDIRDRIVSGGEQGLLSVAFHPAFDSNRLFYVNYTDLSGNTAVVEFRADDSGTAEEGSERLLLAVPQPFGNHNGGQLAFGPDGLLYVGMGDGGSGGDPDDHAQDLESLLGKLVRLDVDDPDPKPVIVA